MTMQTYYGTKRIEASPSGMDGSPGYTVRYKDGYESWSPKDVFEAAYKPITAMGFGEALAAMKDGHRVSRNGDGEIIRFDGKQFGTDNDVYWTPRQEDLLAEDWAVIT